MSNWNFFSGWPYQNLAFSFWFLFLKNVMLPELACLWGNPIGSAFTGRGQRRLFPWRNQPRPMQAMTQVLVTSQIVGLHKYSFAADEKWKKWGCLQVCGEVSAGNRKIKPSSCHPLALSALPKEKPNVPFPWPSPSPCWGHNITLPSLTHRQQWKTITREKSI